MKRHVCNGDDCPICAAAIDRAESSADDAADRDYDDAIDWNWTPS